MQKFSLDIWLRDKSRKVVTRDGREVEILKTDFRGYKQIIGVVKNRDNKDDEVDQWDKEGNFRGIFGESKYDLFFADEEEKLTEFDYAVLSIISDHNSHTDSIEAFAKRSSKKLIDLARKELLKDLPKWKKATEHKDLEKHVAILEDGKVLLSNYLEEGDYYIELEDLKNLPKEE